MKKIKIVLITLFLNLFALSLIFANIYEHGSMITKTRPFKNKKRRPELKQLASAVILGLPTKNKKNMNKKKNSKNILVKKDIKNK